MFYIMEKLAAQCIYELLEQTKHKLTRERKLNFFRITQDYTKQIIQKLPESWKKRISSDSMLSSLVFSPFFYGTSLTVDPSNFSPATAYGIGHKYESSVDKIHDFITGKNDQWFERVSLPWELDVSNYLETCAKKQIIWAIPIPEDVCDIISSFL